MNRPTARRVRRPRKAKPGELRAQWGKLPHDDPDVCYVWGEGTNKADAHLLHMHLASERPRVSMAGGQIVWDRSLVEELRARGYDLTTLRFSIRKLPAASTTETVERTGGSDG